MPLRKPPQVIQQICGPLGTLVEVGHWLHEYDYDIAASLQPPNTLQELHDDAEMPSEKGYHDHHVVEQTSAKDDGFPEEMIQGRDNIVPISAMKHREITGWYQTGNEDFGGLSPRDYLRGKSWEERRAIGLKALIDAGVMKP